MPHRCYVTVTTTPDGVTRQSGLLRIVRDHKQVYEAPIPPGGLDPHVETTLAGFGLMRIKHVGATASAQLTFQREYVLRPLSGGHTAQRPTPAKEVRRWWSPAKG